MPPDADEVLTGEPAELELKAAALARQWHQLYDGPEGGGLLSSLAGMFRSAKAREKQRLELLGTVMAAREKLEASGRLRIGSVIPRPHGQGPGVAASARKQPVTVLLTMAEDHDAFRTCVAAAVRATSGKHSLIILEREGADPRSSRLAVDIAKRYPQVRHLRVAGAAGCAQGLNIGVAMAPGDVVLLGGDCRVSQGWIKHLRDTAYTAKDIATVSAVTTGSGPFSLGVEMTSTQLSMSDLSVLLAALEPEPPMTLQEGNASCLYVRRDALLAVGDWAAVKSTSLEEAVADFCQRAIASGWLNTLNPQVVVYQRPERPDASRPLAAMDGLRQKVKQKIEQVESKRRTELARVKPVAGGRPVLMLVVFVGGGGTPKTNMDLARGLCAHWQVLVLEMTPDEWMLSEVSEAGKTMLESVFFPSLFSLGDPLPEAHEECLRAWLARYLVSMVHFRHWLGSAPEIMETARELGARVVVSLHDFYAVCPSLQLLDATGRCCLGDCSAHAAEMMRHKDCAATESWPGQASGVMLWDDYVHTWRQRVRQALTQVEAIVTMTEVVREITCRSLPELESKFHIIEHGRDFTAGAVDAAVFPAPGQPVRLVFLGEATFVKGADFFIQLARVAGEQARPWEFHVMGKAFVETPELPNLTCHGAYERDALPETLAKLQPTLILLPSRFPETYCHTLTEAWSCAIPVLAHDLGALSERIQKHGGGWLLPDLEPATWLAQTEAILADPIAYEQRRAEAAQRPFRPVEAMTQDFLRLYQSIL